MTQQLYLVLNNRQNGLSGKDCYIIKVDLLSYTVDSVYILYSMLRAKNHPSSKYCLLLPKTSPEAGGRLGGGMITLRKISF
jgi:hypothetical protein